MRAYLTLLGLLSICSFSLGEECKRDLLKNVDFPGSDITSVYSPDAEHCQLLCTQESECHYFTFIGPNWTRDNRHFYCYLKASSGQPKSVNLAGVTSGYSLKPCCQDPRNLLEPCQPRVYENVDFYGSDYRFLFTADYEECQRACTQDPFCMFFTFVNENFSRENIRYKCHLKFSWSLARRMAPIVEAKAGVTSGFSDKVRLPPSSNPVCKSLLFSSTDIPGNDFTVLDASSPQHCQAECSAHPRCTYFSFDSNALECHMKHNPNELVMKPKDNYVSGLPAHLCRQDPDWLRTPLIGVDFRGSDIRYVMLDDAPSCRKACTNDNTCQYYTYVDQGFSNCSYRRRCYLKSDIVMASPPKVAKLDNVVSGFSLKSCV